MSDFEREKELLGTLGIFLGQCGVFCWIGFQGHFSSFVCACVGSLGLYFISDGLHVPTINIYTLVFFFTVSLFCLLWNLFHSTHSAGTSLLVGRLLRSVLDPAAQDVSFHLFPGLNPFLLNFSHSFWLWLTDWNETLRREVQGEKCKRRPWHAKMEYQWWEVKKKEGTQAAFLPGMVHDTEGLSCPLACRAAFSCHCCVTWVAITNGN